MTRETVLIVEDERDILNLISYNLRKEGYSTREATTGEEGVSAVQNELPDIVVLDLMLPGISGIDACRKMKEIPGAESLPVIMLTAKGEDVDVVTGLEAGADDYVVKPFSPSILVARLKAVLRRSRLDRHNKENRRTTIHGIEMDEGRHQVYCDGVPADLSATEFLILSFLASNPGWVFSRSQIIAAVRGEYYPVTDRSVDVQILGIRQKLKNKGKHIITVRGVGYKMEEDKIETPL